MKNITILGFLLLFIYGCSDDSIRDNDTNSLSTSSIKEANKNKDESKPIYKIKTKESKPELNKKPFNKIYINLQQFTNSVQFAPFKGYEIDLSFSKQRATAYANCYKVTASYKETNQTLSFSNANLELDLDHAVCNEFKDADQAVYEMFLHEYNIENFSDKKITLKTKESKNSIILTR